MINSDDLIKAVNAFRKECLVRFSKDIDSLKSEERNERLGYFEKSRLSDFLLFELTNYPLDHIARLIKTPRLLKIVLRRVWHSWKVLHGEIDFDDLLISNVLRFASPEAYSFILENFREIRGLNVENNSSDKEKAKDRLQKKWNCTTENAKWDITAAEKLVAFLFPTYSSEPHLRPINVPQGVRHSKPTDYWSRLNNEEIEIDEIRDQDVLQALNKWKKNNNAICFKKLLLPEALFECQELAPKFEHFAPLFLNGNDFRNIASSLFTITLTKEGVHANNESCSGFLSLWRLSTRDPIGTTEHNKWILDEILKALNVSLRFANDLFYYWQCNSRDEIRSKKSRPELHKPIVEKAKCLYELSPKRLISVLDPHYMYSISQFARHLNLPEQGGSGYEPCEWKWLANLLIEAAKINTATILPQIVNLIFKDDMGRSNFICSFDSKFATELFDERLQEVMSLIAKGFDYSMFDKREKDLIKYAQKFATEWLKKTENDHKEGN